MNKENILVVSASYNEAENIKQFVNDLTKQNYHILIVDDNSPDGTGNLILKSEHYLRNLFLLSRESKQGYGTAYIQGFKWGLEKDYEYIVSMDTDLSHRVIDLNKMVDEIGNFDLIIGSRYTKNGRTEGWGLHRRILSKYANKLAMFVTKSKIKDMTTGFRVYKRESLEKIDFENSQYNGYSFLVDLLNKCVKENLNIKEVPILFIDRVHGKSKMDLKVILEGMKTLIRLYFRK
jgi:dolichol-phosphate mannosyltransferase